MSASVPATPSPAELAVLKHLWEDGAQSARTVHTKVSEETGWSYSTTRTLITRMAEKGLVAKTDTQGLAVYEAKVEKLSLMSRMIRDFASNVLEIDGPLPATAFANSKLLTEDEARELSKLLEEGE